MTNPTLRILIADDHPLFRKGLRDLILTQASFSIVAEVSDGKSAFERIRELIPDIAIIDLDMPLKNGLEIAKELRHLNLTTKIIILTMYKDELFFNEALDANVLGYVLKESAVDDILESINVVASGKYYISPLVSGFLVNRSAKQSSLLEHAPSLDILTESERKILRFIGEGKTTNEIATILFISSKTVENHRTNISQKLNLKGTHSLIKFAMANKSLL